MRNLAFIGLAMTLGALSFGAIASDQPGAPTAASLSVSAASNHSALSTPAGLNEKVAPDGTRSYPMTSVSGQRNMHSTSVVYE
ncbi:hypothetical protein ABK905_03100 [Acerihabitans sp. KWT182]|uniref:Multiple antibiotic resistance protein MarB n=1 Tax=Acerihabitans sp. KWT182 TaxID=3157919 RepID=A0AAU7QBG5_9GAMM